MSTKLAFASGCAFYPEPDLILNIQKKKKKKSISQEATHKASF